MTTEGEERGQRDFRQNGSKTFGGKSGMTSEKKLPYVAPALTSLSLNQLDNSLIELNFFVKYIYTSDSSFAERDDFVSRSLVGARIVKYRLTTDIYPRTDERVDVVIVGGNDGKRLASFIKANLPLLKKIPIIALGNSLSPLRRADLLRLGYDDAINIGSTSPLEFRVKIAAIFRRHQITRTTEKNAAQFREAIAEICLYDELSGAQRRIIELLFQARGKICSYKALTNALSGDYYESSISNLRVVIHNIKPLLRPGVSIENVRGEGYRLKSEKIYR